VVQTEEAQYKLNGLVLMIEGIERNKADGRIEHGELFSLILR